MATGGWAETIHRWERGSGQAYGTPLVGHDGVIVSTSHLDGRLRPASADATGVVYPRPSWPTRHHCPLLVGAAPALVAQ